MGSALDVQSIAQRARHEVKVDVKDVLLSVDARTVHDLKVAQTKL